MLNHRCPDCGGNEIQVFGCYHGSEYWFPPDQLDDVHFDGQNAAKCVCGKMGQVKHFTPDQNST